MTATSLARGFVRPPTETEQALAGIWCEVLNLERVGIDDDFFALGGHSLLAVRVIARIRDVFDVDLESPLLLFDHPTIASLATVLAEAKVAKGAASRIEPREQGPAPASFIQEQLWFLDRLAPGSPVYNIVDAIPIEGDFDAGAMTHALQALVRRHAILRTAFSEEKGQPVQLVSPSIDVRLPEVDLTGLPETERESEWVRLAHDEGRKPFDLTRAPLFRVIAVHLSPRSHRLLVTLHHIIVDEWSMELLHQEVSRLYDAFTRGEASPLPELPIQYADYARWQREWMRGDVLDSQLVFWKNELAGAPTVLELPTDKPRPAVQSFRGATESFALPGTLVDRLQTLARTESATLFMVLEAAFATLLHRYTGQDDLVIGSPISGRTHSETYGLIGCFLNTIVLRSCFTEGMTFRSLLRETRERALGGYAHADLPFEQLVATTHPTRDSSRTPLFQVLFILHNPDAQSQVSKVIGSQQLQTGTSKFDLTLFVAASESGFEGLIEYSTDLFERDSIRRMCRHYATLLEAIVANPDDRITSLPILGEAERRQLLVDWNETAFEHHARGLCAYQLIEAQADRTPDRVAARFDRDTLTYGELNTRANALAHRLRALGVGPDVLIGVMVERSIDMLVALLGIMKAGGAYVPLDPSFPRDRLGYMVADSGMRVLVTHRDLDAELPVRPDSVVRLEDIAEPFEPSGESPPSATPASLAYVLYTSGSTGKPKGVEIPHSALVNFLLSMQRTPGFTEQDSLLAVTTLSFDIAGLELYLPLITGGTVVIASRDDVMDPDRLIRRIDESGCTVMQATPSTWRMLVNAGWAGSPTLRILCGGEALPPDLARELLPRCAALWNMYGPTETTIWSTVQRVTSADRQAPIGRPIANTRAYVLDANLSPTPVGVPGELYLGGDGLARGYLQREDLTRERFIPSPFATGERLYRTGDLARWLPDGTLDWIGRVDHQVKVRGFRIEPGEIEAAIARHSSVREVVVVAREDVPGDRRLVAYYVSPDASPALVEQLRSLIRSDLPEYMMPSRFVGLDALPLTANGKVDRKALPAPDSDGEALHTTATAPRTDTERMVMDVFREVIGRSDFGVFDSFFDLGGHSLMAARLMTRLRASSGVDLPLRNLFERPTVAALAEAVDAATWGGWTAPAELGVEREEIVL